VTHFSSPDEVEQLRQDLHAAKQEVYGSSNPSSPATIVTWRARVSCSLRDKEIGRPQSTGERPSTNGHRPVYFPRVGVVDAPVRYFETLGVGEKLVGPAIIESPVTTVVVDPGAAVERTRTGSLLITP